MTRTNHKKTEHHSKVSKPMERHPLTVGSSHWWMPVLGASFGVFVGLGVLLAVSARQSLPAMFWLGHSRVAAMGTPVRSDLYEVSAGGVRVAKPDPAFTPASDDNIVAVTLSIKNNSGVKYSYFPSVQTYVRDEEGDTYTMHPSMDLHSPLPAGDLGPGALVTGEVSFELPKRLHKFWLYFDPHWSDMAPVVFSLDR